MIVLFDWGRAAAQQHVRPPAGARQLPQAAVQAQLRLRK